MGSIFGKKVKVYGVIFVNEGELELVKHINNCLRVNLSGLGFSEIFYLSS